MSNKWFWVLLVLFLVGGLSAGLLFRRYKNLLNRRLAEPEKVVQYLGSVVITDSESSPAIDFVIKSAVINGLAVDSYETEVVELGGESFPVIKVDFLFNLNGRQKRLSANLFSGITYLEVFPNSDNDSVNEKREARISDIKLNRGDLVNLSVSYIPIPGPDSVGEVRSKCELMGDNVCLKLLNAGFGKEPIDFGEYLEALFANSDEGVLDYKKVIPRAIYVIRQPTE